MLTLSDTQKVGLVMTSFGAFCTAFGILLMMDRGLLALGNVRTPPTCTPRARPPPSTNPQHVPVQILFVTGSVLLVGTFTLHYTQCTQVH
jgi:hypothetical protein